MSDADFDALFTADKPVIFAFHAYPWLIHRLTYRRTTTTTSTSAATRRRAPSHAVRHDGAERPGPFHLVMDTIDRLRRPAKQPPLKQRLQEKLIEHKQYINQHGQTCRNQGLEVEWCDFAQNAGTIARRRRK